MCAPEHQSQYLELPNAAGGFDKPSTRNRPEVSSTVGLFTFPHCLGPPRRDWWMCASSPPVLQQCRMRVAAACSCGPSQPSATTLLRHTGRLHTDETDIRLQTTLSGVIGR